MLIDPHIIVSSFCFKELCSVMCVLISGLFGLNG